MNPSLSLFVSGLISVGLSLAALGALSRPLQQVLGRVCPDEQSAFFWLRYTQVMLTLAPLLLVLIVGMTYDGENPQAALRLGLAASLAGLLLGLISVGRRLAQFVHVPQTPLLPRHQPQPDPEAGSQA